MILAREIIISDYDIFYPLDIRHNFDDTWRYTAYCIEHYLKKGYFLKVKELDSEINVSAYCYYILCIWTMIEAYKNIQYKAISHLIQKFTITPNVSASSLSQYHLSELFTRQMALFFIPSHIVISRS